MHTRSKRYQRRHRARLRRAQRRTIPLSDPAPKYFSRFENRLALHVAAGLRKRRFTLLEMMLPGGGAGSIPILFPTGDWLPFN